MTTKLTFTKNQVETPFKVAFCAVARSEEDKSSGQILFRCKDGVWEVVATAPPMCAVARLEGIQSSGEDSFTLPAWRVEQWLGAVSDRDAECSIEHKDGVSRLVTKLGTGRVASSDPSTFPTPDAVISAGQSKGTLRASALKDALSYASMFAYDEENRNPNLCVVEVRNGHLISSNIAGIAVVEIPGLKDITLRIGKKNVGSYCRFLDLVGESDVEVWETAQDQYLTSGPFMLGSRKWAHEFPVMSVQRDDKVKCSITVGVSKLREALKYVTTFAERSDRKIFMSVDPQSLYVSATSALGLGDRDTSEIPLVTSENVSDLIAAHPQGFHVQRDNLDHVLSRYSGGDTLEIGIGWKKNGYIRVRHIADGVDFYTLIVWMR